MPSPVGHVLGGVLFGWMVAGAPRPAGRRDGSSPGHAPAPRATLRSAWWRVRPIVMHPWTVGFGLLGALPDIDFLFGIHSQQTHSLGAAALVFVVASGWGGRLDLRRGLACALAYGSHALLDWLGSDTAPPIGVMALWPLDHGFHQSNLHVFDAIKRQYWTWQAWTHNAVAVLREVVLLLPLVTLTWWARRGAPIEGAAQAMTSTTRGPRPVPGVSARESA